MTANIAPFQLPFFRKFAPMATDAFIADIKAGYTFGGESLLLGAAMLDGEVIAGTQVRIPLRTMNRHGLIAGATGTGKTKTLQAIVEGLSRNSVPVLMMDIKGDLSGIAAPGTTNTRIEERHTRLGLPWKAEGFPVELLTLSEEKGTRLRATVSEFGPVLIGKILGLNDTQGGLMALIFKYCDDNQLPLLDLKDLKKVLQYISNEGKEEIAAEYGAISTTSAGTILRKIIELEQQGAERFFGEKSFEVGDLCRISDTGLGMISILRLTDLQDRPKLFSTFMLCLLAEIYSTFPEAGDLDAPKLVIFIDEAHLMFDEASKALNDQIETMVKLIRSKGVGLFFCTQNPQDVPDAVLAQLGMKVQHALRAFTAKDRKEIKTAAENFPETTYYKVDDLLTQLGIGEALVTVLSDKGTPTPLVATMLVAPSSRMDILTPQELGDLERHSHIAAKYNQEVDRESAYELLEGKLAEMQEAEKQEDLKKQKEKEEKEQAKQTTAKRGQKSTIEKVVSSPVTNTIAREVTRGILGVLGLGGRSRGGSRKSTRKGFGWF